MVGPGGGMLWPCYFMALPVVRGGPPGPLLSVVSSVAWNRPPRWSVVASVPPSVGDGSIIPCPAVPALRATVSSYPVYESS